MISCAAILDKNEHIWSLPRPNRHGEIVHMMFIVGGRELLKDGWQEMVTKYLPQPIHETFIRYYEDLLDVPSALRCFKKTP